MESNQSIYSIKALPASAVLFESEKTSSSFTQQTAYLTQDQFVFYSLSKTYYTDNCSMQLRRTIIVSGQGIVEELCMDYPQAQLIRTHKQPCVFLVIHMLRSQIHPEGIAPLLTCVAEQELTLQNTLCLWEIPFTSYRDDQNYYTELHIPICRD